MGEKVKVSREVAELATKFDHRQSNIGVIEEIICAEGYDESQKTQAINAFLNGYEVEETPEEKILDYYKREVYIDRTLELAKRETIHEVLMRLGIKIKGVNE